MTKLDEAAFGITATNVLCFLPLLYPLLWFPVQHECMANGAVYVPLSTHATWKGLHRSYSSIVGFCCYERCWAGLLTVAYAWLVGGGPGGRALQLPSVPAFDANSVFHASALFAAAIDSVTLPYRCACVVRCASGGGV